ncbi:MAG: hypothetical protein RIC18_13200 [Hoeflea sp.]
MVPFTVATGKADIGQAAIRQNKRGNFRRAIGGCSIRETEGLVSEGDEQERQRANEAQPAGSADICVHPRFLTLETSQDGLQKPRTARKVSRAFCVKLRDCRQPQNGLAAINASG